MPDRSEDAEQDLIQLQVDQLETLAQELGGTLTWAPDSVSVAFPTGTARETHLEWDRRVAQIMAPPVVEAATPPPTQVPPPATKFIESNLRRLAEDDELRGEFEAERARINLVHTPVSYSELEVSVAAGIERELAVLPQPPDRFPRARPQTVVVVDSEAGRSEQLHRIVRQLAEDGALKVVIADREINRPEPLRLRNFSDAQLHQRVFPERSLPAPVVTPEPPKHTYGEQRRRLKREVKDLRKKIKGLPACHLLPAPACCLLPAEHRRNGWPDCVDATRQDAEALRLFLTVWRWRLSDEWMKKS